MSPIELKVTLLALQCLVRDNEHRNILSPEQHRAAQTATRKIEHKIHHHETRKARWKARQTHER